MGLFYILRDLVTAMLDSLAGRSRRRYEHAITVRASREIVWTMLRARDIGFDGYMPLRICTEPLPGRPDLERVIIRTGKSELVMVARIVDERPGHAILYQILPDGTDALLIEGQDDYIAFVLVEIDGGTRLSLIRETSPKRWISRISVPLGLRSGGERYKRKAEAISRTNQVPETEGP